MLMSSVKCNHQAESYIILILVKYINVKVTICFFQLIINDSRIKKALIVIGNLTKTVSYIILHLRPPTFVECMPIINYKIKMPVFVNFVSAFGYVINSFLIVKLFGKRKALLVIDPILSNW